MTATLLRPVHRLDDLRVDGSDPMVVTVREQIERNTDREGRLRDSTWLELVHLSHELGWWELWLRLLAPSYVSAPFALHHREFWAWWMSIGAGRPRPFVGCWNRGGAKTTNLQLALLEAACVGKRNYCLYIGATQYSVEDKVSAVGELLTGGLVGRAYPEAASLYQTALGRRRDYRKARIRTGSGFTLDALGMDQAIRGIKLEEERPGIIVLDDLESITDTEHIRAKKIETVTTDILGAVDDDTIVVYIQNLIHENSIMAQVIDGRLDFIADRIVSGPVPQVEGLEWGENPGYDPDAEPEDRASRRFIITAGEPTWEGLDLDTSEQQLNTLSPHAFETEKQHNTDATEGTMFKRNLWQHMRGRPNDLVVRRAWDLAATEGGGDWTVGVLMGVSRSTGDFYVLDVIRGQWGDAKVEQTVVDTADQDAEDFPDSAMLVTVIEDQPGAAGKAWRRRWKREILIGHPHKLVPPQGNKTYRARGYAAAHQNRQLFLPMDAGWVGAWVREHALFDVEGAGAHDDQVDAGALAFNQLTLAPRKQTRARTAARRSLSG